jgi:hypothetical protein
MSFDKFIQTRVIAEQGARSAVSQKIFPEYGLLSFISFETDGYLIGAQMMSTHNATGAGANNVLHNFPVGFLLAKVSGPALSIPSGGIINNFSAAQILISHLQFPSSVNNQDLHAGSRQTIVAYDAESKRIPIKSNEQLGVYGCFNADNADINFAYTFVAYFVRS